MQRTAGGFPSPAVFFIAKGTTMKATAAALRIAAAAFCWLCCAAAAHEFKLDAVVNAFVTVEGREAHLVLRAPLYLFKPVRFPVSGIEIDLPMTGEALERSLVALQ